MPQLDETTAKEVTDYKIEPGQYVVVLTSVTDVDDKTGKPLVSSNKGTPYWLVKVEFPADANDGAYAGRKMNRKLWIGPNTHGFFSEFFDAFGVPSNTNTDTLVGERCLINVQLSDDSFGGATPEIRNFLPLPDGPSISADKRANGSGKSKPAGTDGKDLF